MDPALLMERLRKVLAPEYSVLRLLGRGGMGFVYLGYDPALDRPIAIKVLTPELATAAIEKRFLNEARTIAKLAPHPHIVPSIPRPSSPRMGFPITSWITWLVVPSPTSWSGEPSQRKRLVGWDRVCSTGSPRCTESM